MFHLNSLTLYMEMAGDVAFALHHIEKEQQLNYLAYYDTLTGLANHTLFRDRLVQHVNGVERNQGKFALAIFDIERFKMITTLSAATPATSYCGKSRNVWTAMCWNGAGSPGSVPISLPSWFQNWRSRATWRACTSTCSWNALVPRFRSAGKRSGFPPAPASPSIPQTGRMWTLFSTTPKRR